MLYEQCSENRFIEVKSIIQESGLSFVREMRGSAGCTAESVLGEDSHAMHVL